MSEKSDGVNGMKALAVNIKEAAQKIVRDAEFDKTGIGTVTGVVDGGYKVQAFGGEYIIYDSGGYGIGQTVTVTAPQNNFNKLYMGDYRVNTVRELQSISEDVKGYIEQVTDIKEQLDGQFMQYFYAYEPTVNNMPANQWTSEAAKAEHERDIFFDTRTQQVYRWSKNSGVWKWELDNDSVLKQTLCIAAQVKDTADGKRRIFIAAPTVPYDAGDMWVDGTTIRFATVNRTSGSFTAAEWAKKDDYTTTEDAKKTAQDAVTEYDKQLNAEKVFNKLTDNGRLQGIYQESGNYYINASYIKTGVLSADLIKTGTLSANLIRSGRIASNDGSTYFDLDGNRLVSSDGGYIAQLSNASLDMNIDGKPLVSLHGIKQDVSFAGKNYYTGELVLRTLWEDTSVEDNMWRTVISSDRIFLGMDDRTYFEAGLYGVKVSGDVNLEWGDYLIRGVAGISSPTVQNLTLKASDEQGYWIELSPIVPDIGESWNIHPYTDASVTLGCATRRWGQIYSNVGSIYTSDETEKYDIEQLSVQKAKDLLFGIQPITYKFVDGKSGRTHWGFGAQSVEKGMNAKGITAMDFAGLCYDKYTEPVDGKAGRYGLRYDEFIAPIVALLQAQQKEIDELKTMITMEEK